MILAGTRPPWFDDAQRAERALDDAAAQAADQPDGPVEADRPGDQLSAVDIRPRPPAD